MAMEVDVVKAMILAGGGSNKAKAFDFGKSPGAPYCRRCSFDPAYSDYQALTENMSYYN